jgi:hypothetical protein
MHIKLWCENADRLSNFEHHTVVMSLEDRSACMKRSDSHGSAESMARPMGRLVYGLWTSMDFKEDL